MYSHQQIHYVMKTMGQNVFTTYVMAVAHARSDLVAISIVGDHNAVDSTRAHLSLGREVELYTPVWDGDGNITTKRHPTREMAFPYLKDDDLPKHCRTYIKRFEQTRYAHAILEAPTVYAHPENALAIHALVEQGQKAAHSIINRVRPFIEIALKDEWAEKITERAMQQRLIYALPGKDLSGWAIRHDVQMWRELVSSMLEAKDIHI